MLTLFHIICILVSIHGYNIKGYEKSMLGHLIGSFLNENYPPSVTDVFIYDNVMKLQYIGDFTKLNKTIFKEVERGNFVYFDVYTLKKTRLSNDTYEDVGALVIGTIDDRVLLYLKRFVLKKRRKMLQNYINYIN